MPTVDAETLQAIQEDCFCLALKRAARSVARRYDDALSPLDLGSGQFSMLAMVAGHGPVGIAALGSMLGMDRTTVTAALKPLQRRGLVGVDRSKADPRGRDASLTRAGRALLARAIPLWEAQQARVESEVSLPDVARLREDLRALR